MGPLLIISETKWNNGATCYTDHSMFRISLAAIYYQATVPQVYFSKKRGRYELVWIFYL